MSTKAQQFKAEEVDTPGAELPEGWCKADLEQCIDVLDGRRVPVNSDERKKRIGTIPYYGATGQVGWINDFLFDEELLLLGEDGAPFLDKSKPIAYIIAGKSWVNNHAHVLRAIEGLALNQFLKYFLDSFDFSEYVTGSTRLKLTQGAMNTIPVSLAPLREQTRIVSKIDAVTSELTRVRERLERSSALLKHFRQAVLAAACSGKLTEDWRERRIELDTGEQLIQRIVKQRPSDSLESSPAMRQADAELPDGWCWTSLDTLIIDGPQNGLYKPSSEYGEGGSPIIRIEDFQNNSVRTRTELSKLKVNKQEAEKYAVHPNDLVINRVNSPSHIGKCLLVPQDLCPAVFESNMMRISISSEISPVWIATYIRSDGGRARLTADAKWAVNQVSINQTDVVTTPVPIPSRREQDEIVRRVEVLFKLADTIEKRVAAATLRAERLTQSVLAKAFRGELVPTEAELARREGREYEPASVLLERIKAERDKAGSEKPKRRARVTSRR